MTDGPHLLEGILALSQESQERAAGSGAGRVPNRAGVLFAQVQ